MSFAVAILGRPNVGKSTLFNRLVGRPQALVDRTPGLTRDRREGDARLSDLRFRAIDTAGLEEGPPGSLAARARKQSLNALAAADIGLFLIDARDGITADDLNFAQELRKSGKELVLLANKAEGKGALAGIAEATALGLGEPLPISAAHGEGMGLLYDRLLPFLQTGSDESEGEDADADPDADPGADAEKPLLLAIVGRPNVGKSTLVNKLLREERLLAGPEPGITRDAIAVDWVWKEKRVRLVDTAGVRRRSRIDGKPEALAVADTQRAIRFAETVILVVDALAPLERQDLAIARAAAEEGRALLVAATKWDVATERKKTLALFKERLEDSLAQLQGISLVPVSGRTGFGLDALMKTAFAAHAAWNRRVKTGPLNRWLAAVEERHPPPLVAGRRLKLRYLTQVNTRPPTFALFASKPGELPESYRRYLVNALRRDFALPGTPIRMMLRKGENPYARS